MQGRWLYAVIGMHIIIMPPQHILVGIDFIMGIMRLLMSMNVSFDMRSGIIIFIVMPSLVISQDMRHIIIGIIMPFIIGFTMGMPPIIGFIGITPPIIGIIPPIIGFIMGIMPPIMGIIGISPVIAVLVMVFSCVGRGKTAPIELCGRSDEPLALSTVTMSPAFPGRKRL